MHHSGVLKILARHFCIVYLVVFTSGFLLSDDPVTNSCTARPLAPSSLATLANAVSCVVSGNRACGVLQHVLFSSSPAVALVLSSRAVCWRSSFLNLNFNPPSLNLWLFHLATPWTLSASWKTCAVQIGPSQSSLKPVAPFATVLRLPRPADRARQPKP